jgi:hypothetical protein
MSDGATTLQLSPRRLRYRYSQYPHGPAGVGDGKRGGFRLELPEQLVDVALPRADHTQRHHLRTAVLRRVGHSNGVLVNIETDEERLARLAHG